MTPETERILRDYLGDQVLTLARLTAELQAERNVTAQLRSELVKARLWAGPISDSGAMRMSLEPES